MFSKVKASGSEGPSPSKQCQQEKGQPPKLGCHDPVISKEQNKNSERLSRDLKDEAHKQLMEKIKAYQVTERKKTKGMSHAEKMAVLERVSAHVTDMLAKFDEEYPDSEEEKREQEAFEKELDAATEGIDPEDMIKRDAARHKKLLEIVAQSQKGCQELEDAMNHELEKQDKHEAQKKPPHPISPTKKPVEAQVVQQPALLYPSLSPVSSGAPAPVSFTPYAPQYAAQGIQPSTQGISYPVVQNPPVAPLPYQQYAYNPAYQPSFGFVQPSAPPPEVPDFQGSYDTPQKPYLNQGRQGQSKK